MKRWIGKWAGGRVRETEGGGRVWVVRRRMGGGARREFAIADNAEDAQAEFALFKRDPAGYQTRRAQASSAHRENSTGGVRLDAETLQEFLTHCAALVARGELTEDYRKQTLAPYLTQWADVLGGADLKKISLDTLLQALKKKEWSTARRKRIVALKAFTRWAREEKDAPKLKRKDDPTIDLKTPKVFAGKSVEERGYPAKVIERLYRDLESQAARDTVCLHVKANGMHDTEIGRVARGEAKLRRISDPSGIEGTITFHHAKKDAPHVIACDAQTFAAAERLRARKAPLSRQAMRVMLYRIAIRWHGCKGITKTRINKKGQKVWERSPCKTCPSLVPSQLRHSFGTLAAQNGREVHPTNQRGVDLAKISAAMGHTRMDTLPRFYLGERVPPMIALPLRLEHTEDPIPLALGGEARLAQ